VHGSELEGFEDEEVHRALKEVAAFGVGHRAVERERSFRRSKG
jgi:hypothetical protein